MSAAGLVDQQARGRIANDLDQNLCVEAAAGTGKTTVLVNRVVNLLATGTVTVDELVVITFTEKAAAELATRVRDKLEERANGAGGEERERLLVAARELYRAHIETIHSFATALLRERPVEAKLDPLFEVLQGLAGSLDFDAAYERFQDRLLAEQLPELEMALRRGIGLSELRQACEHLNEHRYLLPLEHRTVVADDVAGTISELRGIADQLREMLIRHQPPGDDKAIPVIEAILDWVARLETENTDAQERMLIAGGPKPYTSSGTAGNWGGEKRRLKELREDYAALIGEVGLRLRSNALLALLPHVESFVETYEQERRRAGTADFDDLLFWARDLLRDDRPAREYFRRRFRAVLIDEFQDTDPVQAELALLLTSDEEPGDEWRSLRPGLGRLTVVGDPKQSIYRFRRADIVVYEGVKDGPLAGGSERISTNFRSNAAMLNALNAVFDKVMAPQPGLQPGNVALEQAPGAPAARRPPVILVEGAVEGDAGDVRQAEAGVLAGLLHKLHEERWEIRDRRDAEWRPCRWGDMAILMPARTGLEIYEEALAGAGIPYRHEGSRDFFQRDEVRDLIWVLAAIDDPTDRIALVGALRSSAFAISDQLKHCAAGPREIETASSRERSRGPLAAEVATYGATLLVGDGPPLPVGDAVHMVMERVSFPDGSDLEVVADDVCKEGAITEQTDDVIAMCRACLQAPSVKRAAASRRYWREVPFVLSRAGDPVDADSGPLVNGRVDVVYQENDELAVIDYKTDKNVTKDTAEKHALEHHSGQAEVYAQALAAATGMPVREVVFVYCKAGTEVRLRDGQVL